MVDLISIFRAGFVRRWHTNPDLAHTCDRIDGHSARVARIILALHPDPSAKLLHAALIHDDGESVVGDVPATIKRGSDSAEALALRRLWGDEQPMLAGNDHAWLKFADRFDAYMWAAHHAPHVLGGWPSEWTDARDWLVETAGDLGCCARVLATLRKMEARHATS